MAWNAVMSVDVVVGATLYKVERSIDGGSTWVLVSPANLASPAFTYSGSEAGLTLFRWTVCKGSVCSTRSGDGPWHNEAQSPLNPPINMKVQ